MIRLRLPRRDWPIHEHGASMWFLFQPGVSIMREKAGCKSVSSVSSKAIRPHSPHCIYIPRIRLFSHRLRDQSLLNAVKINTSDARFAVHRPTPGRCQLLSAFLTCQILVCVKTCCCLSARLSISLAILYHKIFGHDVLDTLS